jgi:large subunit ribosomal protein L29
MVLKISDLRSKESIQLKEMLLALRKESLNIRFQRASGQFENTVRIREISRTIARIKTILNEKNIRSKTV